VTVRWACVIVIQYHCGSVPAPRLYLALCFSPASLVLRTLAFAKSGTFAGNPRNFRTSCSSVRATERRMPIQSRRKCVASSLSKRSCKPNRFGKRHGEVLDLNFFDLREQPVTRRPIARTFGTRWAGIPSGMRDFVCSVPEVSLVARSTTG
jgi:hypothetical protein